MTGPKYQSGGAGEVESVESLYLRGRDQRPVNNSGFKTIGANGSHISRASAASSAVTYYPGEPEVSAKTIWRQPLAIRARSESINGIVIHEMPSERSLKKISCLAVHNTKPLLGVADTITSKSKTVFKIMDFNYQVVKMFQQPGEFLSSSWLGDVLLASSSDSTAYCYKINLDSATEKVQSPQAYALQTPTKTAIRRILLQPLDQSEHIPSDLSFFMLSNKSYHIWALENPQKPLVSVNHLGSNLTSVDWNHCAREQFAVAKASGSFTIHDMRVGAVGTSRIWKHKSAHVGAILDLKWNPLVPHWIATAGFLVHVVNLLIFEGDDANINIWDLRYGSKPLFSLQEHFNSVSKLGWSWYHPEILASGGNDRCLNLFSLSLSSHLLSSYANFTHHVVGVSFSPVEPNQYIAASANGEITSISLQNAFYEPLAPHRYSKDHPYERDIETDIYNRNFQSGYKKLIDLGNKYKLKGDSGTQESLNLNTLLELVYPKDNQSKDLWNETASIQFQNYQSELFDLTYKLPAAMSRRFIPMPDKYLMQQLDALRLNTKLQLWQAQEEYTQLVESSKEIYQLVKADKKSFSADTLRHLIIGLRSYDFLNAIELGISLLETYEGFEDFQSYAFAIGYPLLYPTIFDELPKNDDIQSFPINFKRSDKCNSTQKVETAMKSQASGILSQLRFVHNFIKFQISGDISTETMNEMIELFDGFIRNNPILSTTLLRNYFHVLLNAENYEKFFEHIIAIIPPIETYPFYQSLRALMNIAVPKLKASLKSYAERNKQKPWTTSKIMKAFKISIAIVTSANKYMPLEVLDLISSTLKRIIRSVKKSLNDLIKKPDPSLPNMTGQAQTQRKATALLAEVNKIINVAKLPDDISVHVKSLTDLLNIYISGATPPKTPKTSSSSSSLTSSSSRIKKTASKDKVSKKTSAPNLSLTS